MDKAQKYKIDKDKVSYRIIDGEAVILNMDNGAYYSLNSVGSQIWEDLNKQKPLSEIISSLKEGYEASQEQLEKDLNKLIEDLEEQELIEKDIKI